PATEWKIAGTPVPKVDGSAFVTGKHQYTSDLSRPGMLYGKILRPSGFKASLVSLDDQAAKKLSQVTVVRDGDFVGIAAPDMWLAEQALTALKAQWKVPQQISNRELFAYLKANAGKHDQEPADVTGSVTKAMAAAEIKLSQSYTVAYIHRAPRWRSGKATSLRFGQARSVPSRCATNWPPRFAFRRRMFVCWCPIQGRLTAASTRVKQRSKPLVSRGLPASRSK